jgi:hypothetical protein
MPSLIRIHSGIALCVLVLGTTTMWCSQNARQQETNGDHSVAPVHHGAGSPRGDAHSAQQSGSKAGAHPDNSAVSPAGEQNAIPQSAPEPPSGPQPAQSSAPSDAAEAQSLQPAVGTAVAPAPAILPIAAAEPAGTAVAPAKQRRVRKIVLKVGVLVAATAALGTVLILTETTPSKPAVAH